ncbi:MAG: TolB-like protein/Tfp pilus assembly protein PilF [Lysobacterales bacterium]|jgi:TolB-like protein/Tfp pilus assembly protein PilF
MNRLFEELKERRFWRVLLAYPSVTFVLLQAVEFFINHYGFDDRLLTATILAAIALLPAAMIWNWRHGEEGEQAFVRSEQAFYLLSLIAVSVLVTWYWKATPAAIQAQPLAQIEVPLIAVMPFEIEGEESDLQYLGDGIAENLINWLSSVPGVRVVSRNASFRERDNANDPKALAGLLGANQVLAGNLRIVGDQIETSVAMVATNDESLMWGEKFSEKIDDGIYLERSVVAAIQKGLNLTEADVELSTSLGTDNPLAYQAFQRGHFLIQSTDSASVKEGLHELRRAISADPTFGRPHADIADALSQMVLYVQLDNAALLGEARSSAFAAVALAPQLPESYIALAAVYQYIDFDWQKAEEAYEAAIALNPLSAAPFHRYADYLWVTLQFDRAIEMANRSLAADPLDGNAMHAVGVSNLFKGRFKESASALGDWVRFHPQSLWANTKHAVALSLAGQCELALERTETVMVLSNNHPSTLMLSWLAWTYHVCGADKHYADAKDRLQAVFDDNPDTMDPGLSYYFAIEGRVDLAVSLIERLVAARSPFIMFAQVLVPSYLGWPDTTSGEDGEAYLEVIQSLNFPPNDLIH